MLFGTEKTLVKVQLKLFASECFCICCAVSVWSVLSLLEIAAQATYNVNLKFGHNILMECPTEVSELHTTLGHILCTFPKYQIFSCFAWCPEHVMTKFQICGFCPLDPSILHYEAKNEIAPISLCLSRFLKIVPYYLEGYRKYY